MNRRLFATTVLPPEELSYIRTGAEWFVLEDLNSRPPASQHNRYFAATLRALTDAKDRAYHRCLDARPSGRTFSNALGLYSWFDVRTYLDEMGFNAAPRTPNPEP